MQTTFFQCGNSTPTELVIMTDNSVNFTRTYLSAFGCYSDVNVGFLAATSANLHVINERSGKHQ